MIIILSPSKDMMPKNCGKLPQSTPLFLSQSNKIVKLLKKMSISDIESKMKVSSKLAALNYERLQNLNPDNYEGTHAISTYTGDVYAGMDATSIKACDLEMYQENIFILSALYGILRPLDKIQPYRLEMQTSSFPIGVASNLYNFWSEQITQYLAEKLQSEKVINLASDEYSKVVLPGIPSDQIVTILFRELKNGKPAFVSTFAKKARGLMARYAITKQIKNASRLKDFDLEGYKFDKNLSSRNEWMFIR